MVSNFHAIVAVKVLVWHRLYCDNISGAFAKLQKATINIHYIYIPESVMTKFHCGWLVSLKSGVKFKVLVLEVVAWVNAYDIHNCTLELGWNGHGKCLTQLFHSNFYVQ